MNDPTQPPPSALMIASPYDLEARYSEKRGNQWPGYKVHFTETCEAEAPNFITHVETTLATEQDVTAVEQIHHALSAKALLPAEHFADGAYLSADVLLDSQQDYAVDLIGPIRQDKSWQARQENAFDLTQFVIDWAKEIVTCPTGKQSRYWKPATGPRGKPTIQIHFDKQDCATCAVCAHCTHSRTGPRELTLHPQANSWPCKRRGNGKLLRNFRRPMPHGLGWKGRSPKLHLPWPCAGPAIGA